MTILTAIQKCKDIINLCNHSDGENVTVSIMPKTTDSFLYSHLQKSIENNVRSILPKNTFSISSDNGIITVKLSPLKVSLLIERMKKYIISIIPSQRVYENVKLSRVETQQKRTRKVTACSYSGYSR